MTGTASGSLCVVTASGVRLNRPRFPAPDLHWTLKAALNEWAQLPPTERLAGSVMVAATGRQDVKRTALAVPAGALVLRVFNRQLATREPSGWRYASLRDFVPKTTQMQADRYAEAHNDFMWVPLNEWRSLIPAMPLAGQSYPVPESFLLRLARFHLDPNRGFSEHTAFTTAQPAAIRLRLTVEDARADRLTMRLEGVAHLAETTGGKPESYDPAILGFIEVDRAKMAITRFDMLAVGTAFGLPYDANGVVAPRAGDYPLGIAFELVTTPRPAECLHPRAARDDTPGYLRPKASR